jgi:hypothetical protein
MDGHQLVRLVRATSGGVKIICMSGGTDQPIPANTEYLRKPFGKNVVCECVDKVLHQS